MKIAFTASGEDLDSALDQRFGRAPRFLIYDLEGESFTLVDNGANLEAAQGAGVTAAQSVARLGVAAVVTGNCGPKAYQVLTAAGIKVYNCDSPTVKQALEDYQAGRLREAAGANVRGHWN
jgi:predicted Fe-Mo cluster-binding NifX family protein